MKTTAPTAENWLFLVLAILGAIIIATVAVMTAPGANI
jgi:hypothetical protein